MSGDARGADVRAAALQQVGIADDRDALSTLRRAIEQLADDSSPGVWIHRAAPHALMAQAELQLQRRRAGADLPLLGLSFAVKDNIDVTGMPTTAACPQFAYVPLRSATVVERLQELGAVCFGKTNMDQFATGLTGTRSPYGICTSAYDTQFIAGGSSSGSAVAVAKGLVSFALGTDSGGSGRIPAGFNNIVGLKPTIGAVSLEGTVPNSRCFDCPSIFTRRVEDAADIFDLISGFDPQDPFSRPDAVQHSASIGRPLRFAIPHSLQCEWLGDASSAEAFGRAVRSFTLLGASPQEIDFSIFREAGQMMLAGPWIAERKAGIRKFLDQHPGALLDVVQAMFDRGDRWSAVDVFEWTYRLMTLRRQAYLAFREIDFLLVPTAARPFTVKEVLASPIERNIDVGYYSYFVNPLDLCAITVPNGLLPNGMPTSVTLVAPAWHDRKLAAIAVRLASLLGTDHWPRMREADV